MNKLTTTRQSIVVILLLLGGLLATAVPTILAVYSLNGMLSTLDSLTAVSAKHYASITQMRSSTIKLKRAIKEVVDELQEYGASEKYKTLVNNVSLSKSELHSQWLNLNAADGSVQRLKQDGMDSDSLYKLTQWISNLDGQFQEIANKPSLFAYQMWEAEVEHIDDQIAILAKDSREIDVSRASRFNETFNQDRQRAKIILAFTIPTILLFIFIFVLLTHREAIKRNVINESLQEQEKARLSNIESQRMLLASEMSRRFFTNVIAHELRTPMQSFLSAVDLLDMSIDHRGNNSGDITFALDKMRSTIATMTLQLDDLTEYSRTLDPQFKVRKERFSLCDLSRRINDTYSQKAIEKGLLFSISVNKDHNDQIIKSDLTRLLQVIGNVVENAIKYTNNGLVDIDFSTDSQYLIVRVSDSGIGVKDDDAESIMNPFKRGRNVPSNVFGNGLGLSIAKKLIDLLHGSMTVSSQHNIGTVVDIKIPLDIDNLSIIDIHHESPIAGAVG